MKELNYSKYSLPYNLKPIWLRSKLKIALSTLNSLLAFEFEPNSIDFSKLEKVTNLLLQEYLPNFKSYIVEEQGEPYLAINNDLSLKIEIKNIDDVFSENIFNKESISYLQDRININYPPLFKIFILNFKDKSIICFKFHKLIADNNYIKDYINLLLGLYSDNLNDYKGYTTPISDISFNLDEEKQNYQLNNWVKNIKNKGCSLSFPQKSVKSDSSLAEIKQLTIKNDLKQKLNHLAVRLGTNVDNLVIMSLIINLSKFVNNNEIVLAASNNLFSELKGIINHYMPFLFYVDYEKNIKELLLNLTKSLNFTENNHFVSVTDLKQKLNLSNNDFNFSLEKNDLLGFEANNEKLNINLNKYYIKNNFIENDLSIQFVVSENVIISIEYNRQKYDSNLINNFLEKTEMFLNWVVNNKNEKIKNYVPLSNNEIKSLVTNYNNTCKVLTENNHCWLKFAEIANRYPNNIAIINNNKEYSYRYIYNSALSLANSLRKLDKIKSNNTIAICMDRNINLIISIFAVLSLRKNFVLLLPSYPKKRLEYICKNSEAEIILVNNSHLNFDFEIKTIIVSSEMYEHTNTKTSNLENNLFNSSDICYKAYTSGSTGEPKGIAINHYQFSNLIYHFIDEFKLSNKSIILNVVEVVFDVFIMDLFLALFAGATLNFPSSEIRKDPKKLARNLERVSLIQATTSYWQMIAPFLSKSFKNAKAVIFGEKILTSVYSSAKKYFDEVYSLYGITEVTVFSSYKKISDKDLNNIGVPIPNTKFFILDKNLNLSPVGVPGVLYIAGLGLPENYLQSESLTKQFFIEKSILNENFRLYKTNDLVKWNFNQELEILGRVDNQLKIRGNRVDLSEIEKVINSLSFVERAIVVCDKDNNNTEIMSYIKVKPKSFLKKILQKIFKLNEGSANIYSSIKKFLPEYMLPNKIYFVEEFYKTETGKVDKNKLPKVINKVLSLNDGASIINYDGYSELVDYPGKEILNIWQKVLPNKKISIRDDFFSIGGNSLLVVKLVYEINSIFNLDLPVIWAYQNKTIISQHHNILEKNFKHEFKPVIQLNEASNSLPKLFMIHTVLVGCQVYENFAKQLQDKYQCYGVDYYNLHSGKEKITDLKEMVKLYAGYIKQFQPIGPYNFLGWSLGGIFALEIAKFFIDNDEKVDNLYILDAFPIPGAVFWHVENLDVRKSLNQAMPDHLRKKINSFPEKHIKKIYSCLESDYKMLSNYKISKYSGRTTLVKSTRASSVDVINNRKSWYGWKEYLSELKIYEIDADHFDFMLPKVSKEISELIF